MRTDRNKETRRPICTLEKARKELQPRVIAIHDKLALFAAKVLGLDLREPCILRAECGGRVRLGEVQDHIDEGGDGASGDGFDAGHGNGWRGSMSCERERSAVSYQTGRSSVCSDHGRIAARTSAQSSCRCPRQRQSHSSAHPRP